MSEAELQEQIQLEGPHFHCVLERNNSGQLETKDGRVVRFGLGNRSKKHAEKMRSSDLVGITSIVVTQEMVGSIIGVFTAVEVKAPDWNPAKKLDAHETAQKNWINWVIVRGGLGGFANSLESFRKILGR